MNANDLEDVSSEDSQSPKNLYKNALLTGQEADLTFLLKDDNGERTRPIRVCRAILKIKSKYFAALIGSDREITSIDIDMDFDVFNELIYFVYTDTVRNFRDMYFTIKLMDIAEQCLLRRLKSKCEEKLINEDLSVLTAIKLLTEADKYDANSLETNVLSFIKRHFDAIRELADYRALDGDLLRKIVDVISPSKRVRLG